MILFNAHDTGQLAGSPHPISATESENEGATGFHGNKKMLIRRSGYGDQYDNHSYSLTEAQNNSDWESNHQ